MTRQQFLALGIPSGLAAYQFQTPAEQLNEFFDLINKFTVDWNRLLADMLEGKRPVKLADDTEEAFRLVKDHPAWPGRRKK